MEQTLMSPGATWGNWKKWLVAGVVLVTVVAVATPLGWLVTALGFGGLLFVLLGLVKVRKAIAARSVDVEPIGSFVDHDGVVAVQGTARAGEETVTAPMTGTESVAYRVKVSRYSPEQADG